MMSKSTKSKKSEAKRGRPPIHPADMDQRIMVRTTVADRDRWTKAAQREGLTLSTWLRRIANVTITSAA